jgi:6-pyruvoyltetrahydropterin/6-carboxytetrahydropterin synthase
MNASIFFKGSPPRRQLTTDNVGVPRRAVFGPLSKIASGAYSKRSRVLNVTRGTKYDRGVRGEENPVAYQDLTHTDTAVADQQAKTSGTTVKVSRRESFNAAHQLYDPELSADENERLFGKCAHLHGHNYVLEVVVAGEIEPGTGYVLDLKHLSDVVQRQVIQDVDHRNLNTDVPWLRGLIPTAENLALAFWERIRPELPEGKLRSVRLWETDKNWAEVGDHV